MIYSPNSQCHLFPPTELILPRLPLWVSPPPLTQTYKLQSQVADTFSSYHCISITWNHATVCKAHEKGNPLSVFAPHSHLTLQGILAVPDSVPPPIGLHIPSLSVSSLIVIYKHFASKYQKMPQCHTQAPIYLVFLPPWACRPRY